MFTDISKCLTTLMAILVFSRVVCSLPVDEVVRSETLKEMRKYMNESLDPCDNFYEFSCANWAKYHPATNATFGTNLFEIMRQDFDEKVKKFMTIDDSTDTVLETKVKSFYQSCVKLPKQWDDYIENLKKVADDFGKMPAMGGDNWKEENFDWQTTVAAFQYKYNIGTIVNFARINDIFNTSASAVVIDHGSNALGARSVYFNDEHESTRVKHKEKMAKQMTDYLGIPKDVATQTAEDIFEFEVSLAHGDPDENLGLQLEDIYFPTTPDKLQSTYSPVLNMTQLLSTAYGSIPQYTYYENRAFLVNLVKVMESTPKKTVANFIYYTLFKAFMYKTPKDIKDQEKYCIGIVKEYFSNVFENIVYRNYATSQTQRELEAMWNDIKLAFEDDLKSPKLNWIHADVRKYALEKLSAMQLEIPAAKVNEQIAYILELSTFDKEDFLENMKTVNRAVATNERDNLYKPPKNPFENIAAFAFTPANLIQYNKITVPVAVLQPHYIFSTSLPSAYNFGRLGTILGHELIHGFDDVGRKHDKVGNMRGWWDSNSTDAFRDRVNCFIDQYEQYEYGGLKLPRRVNQGENIADNGGLRVAYKAYLKWNEHSARTDRELKLETFPDFPYNNKQLFFISFAQEWCADTHPTFKLERVATDSHTPSELRAIAALSNLNEFAKVFNCPRGSPMNPTKKCEIY